MYTHRRAQVSAGVGKPPHGLGVCIGMPQVNGTGNSPSTGRPTPGVVKQDKTSGGSVDTTKPRSGPQRVGMCSGERPIGAAKGTQTNAMASCQPPPPPLSNTLRIPLQDSLKKGETSVHFMSKTIELNLNAGIFVTMNPAGKAYGGRSKLPDNLKQLFRPVAMAISDNALIAETELYSEGFKEARLIGRKVVEIFTLSKQLLSAQQHYDWGLRPLKTILRVAGTLIHNEKRKQAESLKEGEGPPQMEGKELFLWEVWCCGQGGDWCRVSRGTECGGWMGSRGKG